jgi:hypothetical protein
LSRCLASSESSNLLTTATDQAVAATDLSSSAMAGAGGSEARES